MKRQILIALMCVVTLVASAQPRPTNPQQPQPPHRERVEKRRPRCAEPEQMQLVMKTLEKQAFDDQRLEIAELCVALGTFCVRDLQRMAAVFSFDDKRLEFLKFAYDYCSDRENYPMLRDAFTFSSNYDKLLEYIYPGMRRH